MNITFTDFSISVWSHLIISLFLVYFLSISGESAKFIVIPYVIYLIFSTKVDNLPALVILSSGMTSISYFILFFCFLATLLNLQVILSSSLRRVFFIVLILFPFVMFFFIERLMSEDLISAFYAYSYFFGLFPLFFVYLIFRKSQIHDFGFFLLPLLGSLLISFFKIDLIGGIHRINSASYILVLAIFFLILIRNPVNKYLPPILRYTLVIFSFYLLVFVSFKFHILLSVIICLIIVLVFTNFEFLKRFVSVYVISILIIMFISISVVYSSQLGGQTSIIDYTDFANYPLYITEKVFGDRGPIWQGAVEIIKNQTGLLPPTGNIQIVYVNSLGALISDFEAEAHNIFLEFFLRFGFIIGGFVSFVIFDIHRILIKFVSLFYDDLIFLFVAGFTISVFLGGGITGQFVLMSNFSFLMMGLFGYCISYGEIRSENAYSMV